MKIDILCNDGSPLGVTMQSLWGEDGRFGVGGAELALLTMCEGWHNKGHQVALFNDPSLFDASPFVQLPISLFDPQADRDVLIIFRSPNHMAYNAKGFKVWWSCDQSTVGDFASFASVVQKIVTISPNHTEYFRTMYGIQNAQHIDLPVRFQDYENHNSIKIPNRCIFTSIPDRGLMQLHSAWPLITREVPDATLVITSDWRLWDPNLPEDVAREYRLRFARQKGVTYLGAVKRKSLIQEQLAADFHLYPCIYDELFCISVAESQAVGAYPITSNFGSLPTTNMGIRIEGNPYSPQWIEEFVHETVRLMKNRPLLEKRQEYVMDRARGRFHIDRILEQWENIFSG